MRRRARWGSGRGKARRAAIAASILVGAVAAGIPASADEAGVAPPQSASAAPEISGDVASSLEASTVATGSASAHWSVTPQGAFTYSIPIEVPAGRGGLAPKISLTYSSMAGNGLAGIGWMLDGIPTVQRAPGTRGIQYDGMDTYAVNFAGWGTAADSRAELVADMKGGFRARVDDFADYRPSGSCGDGPCSWSMRDGHGNVYTFGDPAMTAPPPPPNKRTGATAPALWELDNGVSSNRGISVWSLSKVVDAHGNAMTVEYLDPAKTGRQLVPSRIVYSAHVTQQTPTREVRFSYEARPDPTPPPYRFDHRLSAIDVIYAGALVRRYVLAYTVGVSSTKSRLFSVQVLGSDGAAALPPIRFGYQDGRSPFSEAATIVRAQGPRSRTGSAFEHVTDRILTGDINGDGRQDIVSVNGNTDGLEVHYALGTPTGLGPIVDYYDDVQAGQFFKRNGWTAEIGDFDGDGFDDLVFAKTGPEWLEWMLSKGSPTGLGNMIPSNDHALWGPSSHDVPCVGSGSDSANWWCGARFNVLDLNGDKRVDLVWSHPEGRGLAYALGQAGGTFGPITVATKAPDSATNDYPNGVTTAVGDFNGDGRVDLLLSDTYQSEVTTAHPPFASFVLGGEAPYIFTTAPQPPMPLDWNGVSVYTQPVAVDMNGDRHADVVYPSTPNGIGMMLSRSGNQIEPGAGPTYGVVTVLAGEAQLADFRSPAYLHAGDFDGDGVGDVLYTNQLWTDPTNPIPNDFDYRQMNHHLFRGGAAGDFSSYVFPFTTSKASVVADIDGDGRSELLWLDDTDSSHLVLDFASMSRDGTKVVQATATQDTPGDWTSFVGSGARLFATDLNGDGIDDIVMAPDPQSADLDWRLVLSNGQTPDLLNYVANETGGHLQVEYTPAADTARAIVPNATYCGTADTTVDPSRCGVANRAPRSLATRVVSDNGRGLVRGKRYTFDNGRVSANAATSDTDLGFYAMETTDEQTGLVSGLSFRQDVPFYGRIMNEYAFLGTPASFEAYQQITDWDARVTTPGASHLFVTGRTRKWVAPDAQGTMQIFRNASDAYAYDDFGNPTSLTTCEGSICVTRRSSFTNDTGAWILGRLDAWTQVVGDGNADPEQRIDGEKLAYMANGVDLAQRQRLLCADADTCFCPRSGDCAATVARFVAVDGGLQYDAFGQLTHQVDALGHATDTTWDLAAAQPSSVTRYLVTAQGQTPFTTSRTFDGLGRVATETDLNGKVTQRSYDALGREVLTLLPTGEVQSTSYEQIGDPSAQHVRVTRVGPGAMLWKERWFDGNDVVWRTQHNGDSGAVVVTDRSESYAFAQRVVTVTRPYFASDGPAVTYAVLTDGLSRTTAINELQGSTVTRLRTFAYRLNQVTETDALGNVRTHTEDERGLVATRTDASGTIAYRFDAAKRLRAVTLPDSTTTVAYGYDGWARMIRESDPWIGTRTTQYDDVGNVVALVDGAQKQIARTYDSLDRLATETTGDGTTQLEYDNPSDSNGRGRLWRVTEPSGKTEMTYDVSGAIASRRRTIAGHGSGLVTAWTFDALGRMTQKSFPDGFTVGYVWTDGDHVGSVTRADGTPIATLSQYTADDRAQVTATAAATTTVRYWPRGDVREVQSNDPAGKELLHTQHTYDDEGNPRTIVDLRATKTIGAIDTDESQSFDYDGAARLKSASGAYGNLAYGYDALGNATTIGALTLAMTPKSFAGSVSGKYDDAGNLAEKTDRFVTTTFAYDGKNRLAHVGKHNTASRIARPVADYAYDWSGARVMATRYLGASTIVTFYADGYEERSEARAPTRIATTKTIDLPGGGVVAQITDGVQIAGQPTAGEVEAAAALPWSGSTLQGMPPGTWYPITTPPGSTGLLLDAKGIPVSRIRYLPYGALDTARSVGFDATTRKFAGRELDEEDMLSYFGARYYDPQIGRFTTADTILGDSSSPAVRFNRYAYANDSPLKLTDPTGHEPGWEGDFPAPAPLPIQPTTIGPETPMTWWQKLLSGCITPACRKIDRATHANPEYTQLERKERVSLGRSIARDLPGFAVNVLVLKDVGALAEALGTTLGTAAFVDDGVVALTRTGAGAADASSFAPEWRFTDTGVEPNFDTLYSRPSWRGGTRMRLFNEQGGKCPLCAQDIEGGVGDIDHMNTTYAERKQAAIDLYHQTGELIPRKQFIDLYHQDLRLTCPSCNRSHWFELTLSGNLFWHGK